MFAPELLLFLFSLSLSLSLPLCALVCVLQSYVCLCLGNGETVVRGTGDKETTSGGRRSSENGKFFVEFVNYFRVFLRDFGCHSCLDPVCLSRHVNKHMGLNPVCVFTGHSDFSFHICFSHLSLCCFV